MENYIFDDRPEAVVESLRRERLNVQKKTFTKWANIHLQKHGLPLEDLFVDLGDGVRLMKLLETITGDKLGKPAKGFNRINKIENVSRCLAFLHSKKMRLENISSEDIVDGKPHLILGLLWTIILRCDIFVEENINTSLGVPFQQTNGQSLIMPQPVRADPPGPKIAKESLLLWCQTKTKRYPGVNVQDFHRSWRDGLAFNALIHSHLPKLIDFESLRHKQRIDNLKTAFDLASKFIGVPKLLDPEDVDTNNPDEKSILIYVSTFCKGLANLKKGRTGGKRIANILAKMMETEKMEREYEQTTKELLGWIYANVTDFSDLQDYQTLEDIQHDIMKFKDYRMKEKPSKYELRNKSEALFFAIQMELKSLGTINWVAPGETSPAGIEQAWRSLERAEHEHELRLRNGLKMQEKLENLAYKYELKFSVQDNYVKEMQKILTDPNYGSNIKQADATFKKHEAFRAGIIARENMLDDLFKIADVLVGANYRRKDEVAAKKKEIKENWNYLLRLLDAYGETFENLRKVIQVLEEMDVIIDEMKIMQAELHSECQSLDAESNLQNQMLKEVQVASWGDAICRIEEKIENNDKLRQAPPLLKQMEKLKLAHQSLTEDLAERRQTSEELVRHNQYLENLGEINAWISEQQIVLKSEIKCKDLPSALLLEKKHESLGSELRARVELAENMNNEELGVSFIELKRLWEDKAKRIALLVDVYQFLVYASECESWILEKLNVVRSLEYGDNEMTCEAQLRRHIQVEEEITTHEGEVRRLLQEGQQICDSVVTWLSPLQISADTKIHTSKGTNAKNPVKHPSKSIKQDDFSDLLLLLKHNLSDRKAKIQNYFAELQQACKEGKKRLQYSKMYFHFKNECEGMEKWITEKEHLVEANEFDTEAEETDHVFENFLTDLASRGLMLEELSRVEQELEQDSSKDGNVALTFNHVQKRWHHLNELARFKERNLKGFTSVLLAHRMCEETSQWIEEKFKIISSPKFREGKSVGSIQRRVELLEREMVPMEEKFKQSIILGEKVTSMYPDQQDVTQERIQKLKHQWENFVIHVNEKQREMNETAEMLRLKTKTESLMEWITDVTRKLSVREKMSDLSVGESVANENEELGNDIASKEHQFVEVQEIGGRLPMDHARPMLHQLEEGKLLVHRLWQEKHEWLQQKLDLLVFDREANSLDRIAKGQDAVLNSADIGDTLGEVEILIRYHQSFMESVDAQESRYEGFSELAERLSVAAHPESDYILTRRDQILEHRCLIREKASQRQNSLFAALHVQRLKADASEMLNWISEKNKIVTDLEKEDSSLNLFFKMKRQRTVEAEINTNKDAVEVIIARRKELLEPLVNEQKQISSMLGELSTVWHSLCERAAENGKRLELKEQLWSFGKSIENVTRKLEDIGLVVTSPHFGRDVRSLKSQLNEQDVLESELERTKTKISELLTKSATLKIKSNIVEDNTFKKIDELVVKVDLIGGPVAQRRIKLEELLKFYLFKSEMEKELLWVSEHQSSISMDAMCRNSLDAQNLQKKIEKVELAVEGHKSVIGKCLEEGRIVVSETSCPEDVSQVCRFLVAAWDALLDTLSRKKDEVYLLVRVHMFYAEISEIETWLLEKSEVLNSSEFGKDEDAVIKHLTKHKALELEIDTYKGLVSDLSKRAEVIVEEAHPEYEKVKRRMEDMLQEMEKIQNSCSARRQRLLEIISQNEFQRETRELKTWINEQMVKATSGDYGEDYEHVLVLHNKFEFFRARLEYGSKRIIQYEEFAKKLISNNCFFKEEVQSSLEYLSELWSQLVEHAEARAFKMEAAAEIHRYHRDVTDILSRIHGHYHSIPVELGNNLVHVQRIIKKHDNFENDLLALEAQVHLLLQDSQRLQEAYPGGNEEHIQMQLSLVVENWNLLQQNISDRKTKLLISEQFHKFLTSVREFEQWAKETRLILESEVRARDLQMVKQLESEHDTVEAEIKVRTSCLEPLQREGRSILELEEQLFCQQVEEKLQVIQELKQKVQDSCEARGQLIQKRKEICTFFHDAKQLQAFYSKKEVLLCGCETRETVEEIDAALKTHLELQKAIDIQHEKYLSWKEQGENLIRQGICDAEAVQKKIDEIFARQERLHEFCQKKSNRLTETLRFAKFRRDTIEAETWIQEKRNRLKSLIKANDELNTEEKVAYLQKQQAVLSELQAHEPRIESVIQQSNDLPGEGSETEEAKIRLQIMLEDWNELKQNVDRIRNDLMEARDLVAFHECLQKVENWIKEKELLVQANDMGKDYEHCVSLQSKLNDSHSLDTHIDDTIIRQMKELAIKLAKKEHQKHRLIRADELGDRWESLKREVDCYRRRLQQAALVHGFVRDVDDTIQRIREKTLILSRKDEPKDLASIQLMQRKHELLEKDVSAIEVKLQEQRREANTLLEIQEVSASIIMDKMEQAHNEWTTLRQELETRQGYLHSAFKALKFIRDVNNMENNVREILTEMEFGETPGDVTDVQNLLQVHQDARSEVNNGKEEIQELYQLSSSLLRDPDIPAEDIESCIRALQEMNLALEKAWNDRKNMLSQSRDFQVFVEFAKLIENTLSSKEGFLANQDTGDSMESVQALIRKHENFENSLNGLLKKIHELEMMCKDLVEHDEYEEIVARCRDICRRRNTVQEASERRKNFLEEAKSLQQFLFDSYEISNWINEKIQVVGEETYRDFINLLSKTQKHAAFEAEILGNQPRVLAVIHLGEKLVEQDHFASEDILEQIRNLEELWNKLIDTSNRKKEHLMEAYEALQLKHKLDDINSWLNETEALVTSESSDQNLTSSLYEMNKFQNVKEQLEDYSERILLLKDLVDNFEKCNPFCKDDVISNYNETLERFQLRQQQVAEREIKMKEMLIVARLEGDINDELSWIEECMALCNTEDIFDDIMSVQAFQKKLQALEVELLCHEDSISAIVIRGRDTDNDPIKVKIGHLEQQLQELRDAISIRRLRLDDALEAQKYYFEAAQAEIWIKEKHNLASLSEFGQDVHTVQAQLKKLNAVKVATTTYQQTIFTLQDVNFKLVERGHFDSENLKIKQEEVNEQHERLCELVQKNIDILKDNEKYFLFERDIKELKIRLQAMLLVANSEDFGRDVEHVESLLQNAGTFQTKLISQESIIQASKKQGELLFEECHPHSELVLELLRDLDITWQQINESLEARFKALESAKLIHTFTKSVDETESWIYEKDVAFCSEDFGHDMASIKSLIKQHDALECDLKIIEEQMSALDEEVISLSSQLPTHKDQVQDKYNALNDSWNRCVENAAMRRNKLKQADQLHSYFEEARQLHAWICEMRAFISSSDLPDDLASCQAANFRHDEYKREIDARHPYFETFKTQGEVIITAGHFMSTEIQNKMKSIASSFDDLVNAWQQTKILLERNLDLQLFKQQARQLEIWLQNQKYNLNLNDGNSIEEIEYLLQKHEQFEKRIAFYETKFEELKRTTLIEEELLRKQEDEKKQKIDDEKCLHEQKLEEIKQREEQRLLEERKRVGVTEAQGWKSESDDDFLPLETVSPENSVFKRIGSKNLGTEKPPDLSRAQTPVLLKKYSLTKRNDVSLTTAEGFLVRKQELQSGGKKSVTRQWKTYYTVLCGQLLCFFKDKTAFQQQNAVKPPVNILNASCMLPKDYKKRKHVFRLTITDKSAFLFAAPNEVKRDEWMQKINLTASLPPSMQLLSREVQEVKEEKSEEPNSKREQFEFPEREPVTRTRSEGTIQERRTRSSHSSLSNQSSYITAASSSSTLHEDQMESSDEGDWYSVFAQPSPPGDPSWLTGEGAHTVATNLEQTFQPEEQPYTDPVPERQSSKKRWKMFSLKRKN